MSRSDEELMREFQEGNDTAFITLYERYRLAIYRFIYRKIAHQARAEELTQEVFLALVRYRKDWRQESSFKTYIYRIAFNCSLSEARRSEHKVMVDDEDEQNSVASDTLSPIEQVEQSEIKQHIKRALAKLDADFRDPIILREYEGLSYEEIATIFDLPIGTVKSRIFRGKLELKKLLTPVLNPDINDLVKPASTSTATGVGTNAPSQML
ncbi:MAG: sigma-70 family RNA polymerase sigma factor [Blastocatellia bacterium]|nr:sigma-70 family RNA polymerase sigma factor [Blastocatellia bacterium]